MVFGSKVRSRRWLPLTVILSFIPACLGSTATVWIKDQRGGAELGGGTGRGRAGDLGYDVTIKESTPDFLVVVPKNGNEASVPCEKIVDVSHPGTGLMITGVTMSLIGVPLLMVGRPSNDSSIDWSGPGHALGIAFLLQGLVMAAAGLGKYLPSHSKASNCKYQGK